MRHRFHHKLKEPQKVSSCTCCGESGKQHRKDLKLNLNRPLVVFHCDVHGWAYHLRSVRMARALPQYDIRALIGSATPPRLKVKLLTEADILVAQGIKTIRRMADAKQPQIHGAGKIGQVVRNRYKNIVARLDSVRVDLDGKYYDIWTGQEV